MSRRSILRKGSIAGAIGAGVGLVEDGWLTLDQTLGLVDTIMRGNARQIFDLERKTRRLEEAPWL
jgi:hypothetical protein